MTFWRWTIEIYPTSLEKVNIFSYSSAKFVPSAQPCTLKSLQIESVTHSCESNKQSFNQICLVEAEILIIFLIWPHQCFEAKWCFSKICKKTLKWWSSKPHISASTVYIQSNDGDHLIPNETYFLFKGIARLIGLRGRQKLCSGVRKYINNVFQRGQGHFQMLSFRTSYLCVWWTNFLE